jgi:hypothetical protein
MNKALDKALDKLAISFLVMFLLGFICFFIYLMLTLPNGLLAIMIFGISYLLFWAIFRVMNIPNEKTK